MTDNEAKKIIGMLESIYETAVSDFELISMVWKNTFKNNTYEEVFRAVNDFVANDRRDYPKIPKPGQVKAYLKNTYRIDHEGRILNG